MAEENGLIEPIGRWVLDNACRQAARWYRERPDAAPISMSVNLSAVQIANRGLAETVAGALRGAGLDPSCLSLEITESVMLGDADGLTDALDALKAIGVRLVLDDFGTGYSSLAYLTRLPLDALKVDRSFIDGLGTEPRDTAITEAIVAMSHALSLRGRRRGRRDRAAGRRADPPGLRLRAGLSLLPAAAGRRDHRDARARAGLAGRAAALAGAADALRGRRESRAASARPSPSPHSEAPSGIDDPQRRGVVGRDHLQRRRRSCSRRSSAAAVGDAEPERDGLRRARTISVRSGAVAEEVVGRVRRRRRQAPPAAVEELDAGIADGRAARGAGVAQREAQLAVPGGALLAEERQRQPGGAARRRAPPSRVAGRAAGGRLVRGRRPRPVAVAGRPSLVDGRRGAGGPSGRRPCWRLARAARTRWRCVMVVEPDTAAGGDQRARRARHSLRRRSACEHRVAIRP